MDYVQAIDSLSPEVFQRLQRAVELGKWPDGRVLTPEQRANAMQAIIAWSERHLSESQRIGFISKQPDAESSCDSPQEQPLNWVE
jgi:uncharacterized protein